MGYPVPKYLISTLPFSRAITHVLAFSLIIFVLQSALPLVTLAEQPPRQLKVLILYGRSTNLPANKIINEGMLPALNAAGVDDADQFQEYLDFQHHPEQKYRLELAAYLRKKYANERFDVIITCHQDAFDFMLHEGKELFNDTPIVAAVPQNTVLARSSGRKVIQVVYDLDALSTLRYALTLLPETKEIIVISGPTADDALYLKKALEAVKKYEGKLTIRYLTNHPLPEILREVARERDHSIILYTRLLKDSDGKEHLPPKVLSNIARVSKSPVFGLYNSLLGAGIVGGNLLSYEDLGKDVARVAVDLMNNKGAQATAVFYLKHTPMFDWAEMKRWGLDRSRLPEKSVLINYRPGFWIQYWGYALIALIFVIGEGVLIAVLINSRRIRLRTEDKLRTNERLLQAYLDNCSIISWMKDEEGRHLFRNETFGKRFAAQSEDWQGKTDFELWPQELAEEFQRNDRIVLRSGQPLETIEKAIDPDGKLSWWLTTKFPFQDAVGKRFVGGLGIDITELKRVEDEIERKHALMIDIMNATDVMLVYLDAEFNFVEVNNAYAATCRMLPEEMIGKNHFALYPDQEAEAIFRQVRDSGVPVFIKDRAFIFPDQPERGVTYWNWSLIPVKDTVGHVIGLVFSLLETTERRQAEEERLKIERRLLKAQKLESLGILSGGIAHDFNNILTSIIGNTELAQLRLDPLSPVQENMKRIETSAQRAANLAKQMLAYSGKGRFVVEPIDLNQTIEEQHSLLESAVPPNAVLRINLTRPLPLVKADVSQIRQVIMNLITNASEAIGDQAGSITISTGTQYCDQGQCKDVWLSDDIAEGLYVFLEVADSGCGMDRETQAKIFDPFFTTKFTGRGLGLAAVQGIVRGHNGSIQISSEPEKGSIFRVLLPAGAEPVTQERNEPQKREFMGEGTVLLVDDEEVVRDVGKEMLQLIGFTVVTANDGIEALAAFKANPTVLCVILDLTMPQMDGELCYRELRMIDPKVKVIISSGYSEQEVAGKFAGQGLSGFIQKPYTMSALCSVLRALGGSESVTP